MLSVQFVIEPGRAVPRASLCDTWVHCTRLFVCWQAGRPTMKYVYMCLCSRMCSGWDSSPSRSCRPCLINVRSRRVASSFALTDSWAGLPRLLRWTFILKPVTSVRKSWGGRSSVPLNTWFMGQHSWENWFKSQSVTFTYRIIKI